MRLYRILHEKKIPEPAEDVVTLMRHFLGKRGYLVERKDWDETRFHLNFCFSFTYGESESFHPVWGGAELIQWSDGTEIVSMSQTTPLGGAPMFFPHQFLNGEDEAAEQLELLEELSDAILEKFDKAKETAVAKPEKPKQIGRYRLTDHDIKFRRQKVNAAKKIKKDNPQKQWKEIDKQFAKELEISDRTFRSWRHNNY